VDNIFSENIHNYSWISSLSQTRSVFQRYLYCSEPLEIDADDFSQFWYFPHSRSTESKM